MKPHQNPAEFILEVTGAGIPKGEQNGEAQGHEEQEGSASQQADGADIQKGGEMKDVEMGNKDENFYVDTYKRSQFFADTTKQLEAGIFPLVRLCPLLTSPPANVTN
jgi:hypothetical protein